MKFHIFRIILVGFLYFNLYTIVKAQDTLNKLQDSSIIVIRQSKISFNGQDISYDSCKNILLSNQESRNEMLKSINCKSKAHRIVKTLSIFACPFVILGFTNQVTNFTNPWVRDIFIFLTVPTLTLEIYYLSNIRKSRKHYLKAVQIYNKTIIKIDKH